MIFFDVYTPANVSTIYEFILDLANFEVLPMEGILDKVGLA